MSLPPRPPRPPTAVIVTWRTPEALAGTENVAVPEAVVTVLVSRVRMMREVVPPEPPLRTYTVCELPVSPDTTWLFEREPTPIEVHTTLSVEYS